VVTHQPRQQKAPYAIKRAAKHFDMTGLRSALSEVDNVSRARLADIIAKPAEHQPIVQHHRKVETPPIQPQGVNPSRSNMANAFQKPDERKSEAPHLREKITCKPRPKLNRRKTGGGGKRRYIPWC